jgi:hypothetical protein
MERDQAKVIIEKSFKVFFTIMTKHLDIGYAPSGVRGFYAITEKGTPEQKCYLLKTNHFKCLLRIEAEKREEAFLQVLKKEKISINKLIDLFIKNMEKSTEKAYESGLYPDAFIAYKNEGVLP